MEFGKRHDTTDTTDFCAHQLVTELLLGNWYNGFWLYASCITGHAIHKQEKHSGYKVSITSVFFNLFVEAEPLAAIFIAQSLSWGPFMR